MRTFRAPGRVNLIGGQVDYHEGWVVSMAIDRDVRVTMTPRADTNIVARSREYEGEVTVPGTGDPAWGRTVAGVAHVLRARGCPAVGATLSITSDIPIGAGLSSSAAFEVACALALADAAGFEIEGHDLALTAQEAEHVATGVPCGIQDQMTAVHGRAGHAVFLDCRTLDIEHVPLPDELRVVVVHSGVPRVLEDTPFAQRRAESFAAAEQVGVRVLRDATFEQVRDLPRGRHAVTEMARVREFAAALRAGDVDRLGPLMLASHASSRDDMGVSIPELDTLVERLCELGALGARLTGAGFGGCVVALVPAERADTIAGAFSQAWVIRAADGAGRLR